MARTAAFGLAGMTAFILAGGIAGASAQEVLGVWERDTGASRVRFSKCGDALCGTISWLKDPNGPAKVGQRILRPATMTSARRRDCDPLCIPVTKLARRKAESSAESSAEMRGITETVTICNFGNRVMGFQGIGEISPGSL